MTGNHKVKLKLGDYLCHPGCKTTKNLKIVNKIDSHFNKCFSLEKIYTNIIDVENMKIILFTEEERSCLRYLRKPIVKYTEENVVIKDNLEGNFKEEDRARMDNLVKKDGKSPTEKKMVEFLKFYE
jgi:hypothetical protein